MLNQNQNSVNPSAVHLVNYRAIIADTNISLTMIDDCIKDFDGAQLVADKSAPALENDADAFEAFAVELDKISRARKDSVYRYRQTVRKLGYYMTARGLITTDKAQIVIKSIDAQLERGDETTARLEVKRGAQQYAELLRRNAQETRRDAKNVDKSTQPETAPAAPVVEETPAETVEVVEETPAPIVSEEKPKQEPAPAAVVAADDRDDIMKDYLTKYDFKKADAVPNMLLDSINKGCPLWSFQWFGFAELPRRYFNGACFSVNNMILLAFHGGYYVSLTEARRILGDKATPKEDVIARAVLRPVFKGAKNLRKSDLDALRNCEPIDDDTQQRRPDFYMVERVYDQTAFDGLELKKEKELPQNENERNAQAESIFRAFCKANNIGFLETEGNGQAVTQIKTNGLGKVESITINMPPISQFKNATAYYSVLFHEATHAANAVNGCQLTKKREELSAEIGSCIVLNTLGFDPAEYIDDSAHYVQRFKDCANEKNAIKKAWKYAQASALLILDTYINEPETETPTPVATVEPKHEPKQEETPAPVKNDDEETIVSALESFEREATQAINTGGLVHQDNARRAENDALLAIEEARKNKSVPDDALKIYSDRVERIHVDTALTLKAEATRRYGAEFIDRHVTFC